MLEDRHLKLIRRLPKLTARGTTCWLPDQALHTPFMLIMFSLELAEELRLHIRDFLWVGVQIFLPAFYSRVASTTSASTTVRFRQMKSNGSTASAGVFKLG